MNIIDNGECDIDTADDANIPVNIWLVLDDETKEWRLTAGNYMPRKNLVRDDAYDMTCATREPLASIITEKWLPLYRTAVAKLERVASGGGESLYYWNDKS